MDEVALLCMRIQYLSYLMEYLSYLMEYLSYLMEYLSYLRSILVIGPSFLVYILIENQRMHQNDHIIVMSSQTLLHVLAYERHHQGAHMILTSYLYVDMSVCIARRTMEFRVN
jgi:hypothetical protein